MSNYPPWQDYILYDIGSSVSRSANNYISVVDNNINNDPSTDVSHNFWTPITSGGAGVLTILGGDGILVDATNPLAPVVSTDVSGGTNITTSYDVNGVLIINAINPPLPPMPPLPPLPPLPPAPTFSVSSPTNSGMYANSSTDGAGNKTITVGLSPINPNDTSLGQGRYYYAGNQSWGYPVVNTGSSIIYQWQCYTSPAPFATTYLTQAQINYLFSFPIVQITVQCGAYSRNNDQGVVGIYAQVAQTDGPYNAATSAQFSTLIPNGGSGTLSYNNATVPLTAIATLVAGIHYDNTGNYNTGNVNVVCNSFGDTVLNYWHDTGVAQYGLIEILGLY